MDATMAQPGAQSNSRKNGLKNRVMGYAGLFLLAFFIFLIATFPYDLLLEGLINHFQDKIPPSLQPLTFEELQTDLPLGVKIKGLSIGRKSGSQPLLEATSFDISAGLFSALFGKIKANCKAEIYGGKMTGSFKGTGQNGKLEMRVIGVQIGRWPYLKNLGKMDLSGKFSTQVSMNWSSVWPKNKGAISFSIEEASAKNVNLKLITTDFKFTKVEGDFSLENGALIINRCVLEGTPSGFEITGKITISPQDMQSTSFDLNIILTPTPELQKSIPVQIFQTVGEGKYKCHLGGTWAQPTFP